MKKVLSVYSPFCSPVSPPYSITYISNFLKRNTDSKEFEYELFDMNAWIYKKTFGKDYLTINTTLKKHDLTSYKSKIKDVKLRIDAFAKDSNDALRQGKTIEILKECLNEIKTKKPDIILFSLVYNSQAFFCLELIKVLKKEKIDIIVGGPAVTHQIKKEATYLPNEVALLERLTNRKIEHQKLKTQKVIDFSNYDKNNYFTPELIISLHTSSCCYYQKCTFCTHHNFGKYVEYNLEDIKKSIIQSNARYVFLIDDMIHKNRLLEIAKVLKPLKVHWMCQLRPTKDLDKQTLRILYESGLRIVVWGVESGNNRILKLMDKGTNITDVKKVLESSKNVGITNVAYIMFGFPTETEDEFIDTINFLKENKKNIDLVSTSIFGLQETSLIEKNPEKYKITKIIKKERKMLPLRINYEVIEGIHKDKARLLRKKYKKTLENINKYPKEMNIYREHMLYFISE